MKALSIRQPWAWLIIHGGKDIENRSWSTNFRGRFLVHAAKKIDHEGLALVKKAGHKLPETFETGKIIGSAELVDVVTSSQSPWFSGPHGFVIKDPKPEEIRPQKGSLNFFEVPT